MDSSPASGRSLFKWRREKDTCCTCQRKEDNHHSPHQASKIKSGWDDECCGDRRPAPRRAGEISFLTRTYTRAAAAIAIWKHWPWVHMCVDPPVLRCLEGRGCSYGHSRLDKDKAFYSLLLGMYST